MALNPYEIRKDFPILNRRINGYPLVYFDNAATSQRPIQVIETIKKFYENFNANIHRGMHTLSQEASDMPVAHRDKVENPINDQEEEVIFVRNTTEAINFVACTWALENIDKGEEIVITRMEHHSNILPWRIVSRIKKAKLKVANISPTGILDYKNLYELVTEKTKLVAVVHVSNVLGTINDLGKIAKIAREVGARLLVDGAQSVPHMPVDVKKIGADFLAFSGHKMLGPTGIGVLFIKKEVEEEIEPFFGGGGTISDVDCREKRCSVEWAPIPLRFEAGTPNIAGAIGLAAAVDYLEKASMEAVRSHEEKLTKVALEELENIKGVTVYGPKDAENRAGIVTFNVESLHPHEVASFLDQYGIAVRSGHHCALPLHRVLGALDGTVRASFYLYNTVEEVEFFAEKLKELISKFSIS
ncbi:MAG: cysteine desulfurase [Thermoprotei archaeon]|nr:MAG: cysteine desulfurase [Thermoprotei archaeon]